MSRKLAIGRFPSFSQAINSSSQLSEAIEDATLLCVNPNQEFDLAANSHHTFLKTLHRIPHSRYRAFVSSR
jgi:hypothetical protein